MVFSVHHHSNSFCASDGWNQYSFCLGVCGSGLCRRTAWKGSLHLHLLLAFLGLLDRRKVEFIKKKKKKGNQPQPSAELEFKSYPLSQGLCLFDSYSAWQSWHPPRFGLMIHYSECKSLGLAEALMYGVSVLTHFILSPLPAGVCIKVAHAYMTRYPPILLSPAQALSSVLWLELPHSCALWFVEDWAVGFPERL